MKRQTLPMVVAIIAGLLGASLVLSAFHRVESAAKDGSTQVTVFVASERIAAGTPGTAVRANKHVMPKRYAPPGAITSLQQIAGLVGLREIEAGETLSAQQFGSTGQTLGQLAIPRGREAVSVSVPIAAGIAEFAQPGDHVSVYATFKGAVEQTIKVLSNVEVLATRTNDKVASQVANAVVLTLAVTPDEAGHAIFGAEAGSLWMTLVPQGQTSPMVAPVFLTGPQQPGR